MHALQRGGLPRIHFENYALCLIDPGFVVSDRRAWHHPPILQDGSDLDQRDIQLAQEPVLHELGDVAEVNVHVIHFTRVNPLAGFWIGLIRKTKMDAPAMARAPSSSGPVEAPVKTLT